MHGGGGLSGVCFSSVPLYVLTVSTSCQTEAIVGDAAIWPTLPPFWNSISYNYLTYILNNSPHSTVGGSWSVGLFNCCWAQVLEECGRGEGWRGKGIEWDGGEIQNHTCTLPGCMWWINLQYYYLGQYDKPELGGKVGYLMLSGV